MAVIYALWCKITIRLCDFLAKPCFVGAFICFYVILLSFQKYSMDVETCTQEFFLNLSVKPKPIYNKKSMANTPETFLLNLYNYYLFNHNSFLVCFWATSRGAKCLLNFAVVLPARLGVLYRVLGDQTWVIVCKAKHAPRHNSFLDF